MKMLFSPNLASFILTVVVATVCHTPKADAYAPPPPRTLAKDREPWTHVWDSARIFPYQQAEQARQLAQTECKPLVIHFIPDSKVGAKQLNSFYDSVYGVSEEVLDSVVVLVVPTNRYASFAKELGVKGQGGFRTVSAYALTPFKEKAIPTCKSGFR